MRKNKIQFFNMIEVALAMAVIALGMTSILGLFPVGLNASRNAISENYCADAVDQMVSYLKGWAELKQANYDSLFKNTGSLPDKDTDRINNATGNTSSDGKKDLERTSISSLLSTLSLDFVTQYSTGDLFDTTKQEFIRVADGWTIFREKSITGNGFPYIYFIIQGLNADTDNDVPRSLDFSAMILVWKEPISTSYAKQQGDTPAVWPATTSYDNFAGLVMEISWPLETPYAERTKRYYYVSVSRPAL